MSKLLEMFQQDFMQNVLAGTAVVAAICAYLGVFIVLRRAVFVGAALAQVSSFGVALSFIICAILERWHQREIHFPPQPFALALTLGATVLLAVQHRERRVPRETVIGVAYCVAGALAILVVAASGHLQAEVLNLLFGNVLTISRAGVIGLAALAAGVGVVHWLFHKEFLFTSFDPDTAVALGVRARFWNIVLFLTIGVTIALAIRAAGALVVFNFLVLPAATALMIGKSLRAVFVVSIILGVASAFAGIAISYIADWPSGATIVAVNAVWLVVASVARRWLL